MAYLLFGAKDGKGADIIADYTDKFSNWVDKIPDKLEDFFNKIPDKIMGLFGTLDDIKYDADGNPIESGGSSNILGKIVGLFGKIGIALTKLTMKIPGLIVGAVAQMANAAVHAVVGGFLGDMIGGEAGEVVSGKVGGKLLKGGGIGGLDAMGIS